MKGIEIEMKLPFAFIALLGLLPVQASAEVFSGTPDVMLCELYATSDRPGGEIVLYISARFDDGRYLYRAPGAVAFSVTVSPDGSVEGENQRNCRFQDSDGSE